MGNSFLGELLFRWKKGSCKLVHRSGERLSFRRLMHPEHGVAPMRLWGSHTVSFLALLARAA